MNRPVDEQERHDCVACSLVASRSPWLEQKTFDDGQLLDGRWRVSTTSIAEHERVYGHREYPHTREADTQMPDVE
jgi:hypothetical protein